MKKVGFLVAALAAGSVALAGPALATTSTASNTGFGPTSSVTVVTPDAVPAPVNAPNTGGAAASADASGGPGSVGSSRPASGVCTQDTNLKAEGAAVDTTGTQCAYNRAATDGTTAGPLLVASPQFKVSAPAIAVPSS